MKRAMSIAEAAALVPDGAVLMIGGFMGVGSPHRLIDALIEQGKRDLVMIGNDTSRPDNGIGKLVVAKRCRKAIVSHIGTNPETQRQMLEGELEVELVPQGTLAERVRAAGYGLGGVLTPTGVGTLAAEGKRTIEIDGREFLVEPPLGADFALISAHQADYNGNLAYTLTAHNFNPLMAMAADTVIAEPDEIVPIGVIPPDGVKTPGVLIDHLVGRAA